jgi:hypothetical protein
MMGLAKLVCKEHAEKMSPELENSKNIVQQQSPVVKFPTNVPEDLLTRGEHDSSLKFVLIPLLHEERKNWSRDTL